MRYDCYLNQIILPKYNKLSEEMSKNIKWYVNVIEYRCWWWIWRHW